MSFNSSFLFQIKFAIFSLWNRFSSYRKTISHLLKMRIEDDRRLPQHQPFFSLPLSLFLFLSHPGRSQSLSLTLSSRFCKNFKKLICVCFVDEAAKHFCELRERKWKPWMRSLFFFLKAKLNPKNGDFLWFQREKIGFCLWQLQFHNNKKVLVLFGIKCKEVLRQSCISFVKKLI
jgi:hypothetical protein